MNELSFHNSELPSGWNWRRVADCFRVTKKPKSFKAPTDVPVPFVPMDLVPLNGREDVRFELRLPDQISSGAYFERGDILLSKITPSFENGKQALANNIPARWGVASTEIIPLQPIDGAVESRFLFYYLLHPEVRSLLAGRMEGSTGRQRVPEQAVRDLPLPVPPLNVQKTICAILAKVQRAIEIEEKLIAATRELKQAAMRQLFTVGTRGGATQDTPYGQIPASWDIRPLNACATVQTGVTKGRAVPPDEAMEVPYLRVANVQDGYLDLAEIKNITIRRGELESYRLREGDVVLTEGGDFDKLGRGFIWHGQIEPCIHQNHVFAVRTDRNLLIPEFLAYLAQSPYGRSYFLTVAHKTTNLACINSTKLKALPVPLPALQEQQEVCEVLRVTDKKTLVHHKKHAALTQLFSLLLTGLMAGTLNA